MKNPKKNFVLQGENEQVWNALENKSAFINYCLSKVNSSSKLQEFLKDGSILNSGKKNKSIVISTNEIETPKQNIVVKKVNNNVITTFDKKSKIHDIKPVIDGDMNGSKDGIVKNIDDNETSKQEITLKPVLDTSGFDDWL
jgi:hypothetical protein